MQSSYTTDDITGLASVSTRRYRAHLQGSRPTPRRRLSALWAYAAVLLCACGDHLEDVSEQHNFPVNSLDQGFPPDQGSGSCISLPSGAAAWYPGEVAAEDLIAANNGQLSPGVDTAPGMVGQALRLSGGSIQVPDSSAINFGPGQDFTIEGWIRVRNADNSQYVSLVDKRSIAPITVTGCSSDIHGYSFFLDQYTGRLRLQLANGPSMGCFVNVPDVPGPDLRDDTFHHVAATVEHRSGGVGVGLYVDGVLLGGSLNQVRDIGDLGNPAPLILGGPARGNNRNSNLYGLMDEITMYRRALSATELQSIYLAGAQGKCRAPILAQSRTVSTPQDTPLDIVVDGTGGTTLTFNVISSVRHGTLSGPQTLSPTSAQFRYVPAIGFTGTDSFVFSVTDGTVISAPATVQISVLGAYGSCLRPDTWPVAWYSGDIDGRDQVSRHDGQLCAGASVNPGLVSNALQSNNAACDIQVSDGPALDFALGQDFTLEAWVNLGNGTSGRPYISLLDKRDASSRGYSFYFDVANRRLGFQLSSGNNPVNYEAATGSGANVLDGQFHHVAVTVSRAAGSVQLYAAGQPLPTRSSQPFSNVDFSNSQPLIVAGPRPQDAGRSSPPRALDEVSIYQQALSAREINDIYLAGAAGKCKCPVIPPRPESCNGVDDDCDGLADEGNPGGGAACSTGQAGRCAGGTVVCQSGGLVCNRNQGPIAESCNGQDDNCNGDVDDGCRVGVHRFGGIAHCYSTDPGGCFPLYIEVYNYFWVFPYPLSGTTTWNGPGYIAAGQIPGTTPLYWLYKQIPRRPDDTIYTTSYDEVIARVFGAGYGYFGIVGYVWGSP